MSDGPHRSLKMSKAWQDLAKFADHDAYTLKEVAEQIPFALRDDLREQNCDELFRLMAPIFKDGDQSNLFTKQREALETLHREAAPGLTLWRLILEHAIRVMSIEPGGKEKQVESLANAIRDQLARRNYQMEEHYLRKSDEERATNMRTRVQQAMESCDAEAMARQFLDSASPTHSAKKEGIDEGVPLP